MIQSQWDGKRRAVYHRNRRCLLPSDTSLAPSRTRDDSLCLAVAHAHTTARGRTPHCPGRARARGPTLAPRAPPSSSFSLFILIWVSVGVWLHSPEDKSVSCWAAPPNMMMFYLLSCPICTLISLLRWKSDPGEIVSLQYLGQRAFENQTYRIAVIFCILKLK